MQPTQSSMLRRTSAGTSPRTTTSETAKPPPDPRSSTVCPGSRPSRAVGLPQPSEACTAVSGSAARSVSEYRSEVIGSEQPDDAGPQQPTDAVAERFLTAAASAPYFSST